MNAGLLLYDEVLRPHEQRDFFVYGLALEWTARPAAVARGGGRPGARETACRAPTRARRPASGLRLGRGRAARRRRAAARPVRRGRQLGPDASASPGGALARPLRALILLPLCRRGASLAGGGAHDERGGGSARRAACSCREEISVADRYAHGDHIKCGVCSTKHKVVRGDRLRLVIADVGPLRDALAQNERMVERLEAELAHARASFGIGANGFGIGLIYALYQVGVNGAPLGKGLLWTSLGVALVSGVLLERANWSFLAKRNAMTRLGHELDEARAEGQKLRTQIREASRV